MRGVIGLLAILLVSHAGHVPRLVKQTREPVSDEIRVLHLVLEDIVTNPERPSMIDFYRWSPDQAATLVGWPKDFHPAVPGWSFQHADLETLTDENRLCLGLAKFNFRERSQHDEDGYVDPFDGPIAIKVFNRGAPVIGSGNLFFEAWTEHGTWHVRRTGGFDP